MDSKSSMNLGGNSRLADSIANVRQQIMDLSNVAANQLKPQFAAIESIFNRMGVGATGITSMLTGIKPGQLSGSNRIANLPPGVVTAGAAVSAGMAGLKIAADALPSNNTYMQQDILTNRARAYGFGAMQNTPFVDQNGNVSSYRIAQQSSISGQNNNITNIQNTLNQRGTITDVLDAARALSTAQAYGLAGAPNIGQALIGAATMSNITPGVGIARSVQAMGSMQQARNVNLLRGQFGINIRGADGSMKSVTQVIDEIWNKLNAQKRGGSQITEQDILISMEPGNAIDTMLNTYFGNDPVLRKQVGDGLLVKAKMGGAALETVSKKQLQQLGFTTAGTTAQSDRYASQSRIIQQTAGSAVAGMTASDQLATSFNRLLNAMTPLIDIFAFSTKLFQGIMGIGNGAIGKVVSGITGFLGGMLAEGGPAEGGTPYVVGEKGPELFVPARDGVVIPNDMLPPGITRAKGGLVKQGGAKFKMSKDDLRAVLVQAGFTGAGLETALSIAQAESGNRPKAWNRDASTEDNSYGLFQINMLGKMGAERRKKFGLKSNDELFDPLTNARVAYAISKGGTNFKPWTTYTSGKATGNIPQDTGSQPAVLTDTTGQQGYPTNMQFTANQLLAGANRVTGGNHTFNYGGVQVTIHGGNATPEQLASAFRALMSDPTHMLGGY